MTPAHPDRSVAIVSLSGTHGDPASRNGAFETVRFLHLPDGDALDPPAAVEGCGNGAPQPRTQVSRPLIAIDDPVSADIPEGLQRLRAIRIS